MDYTSLKNELTLDPAALGYAAWLPSSPGMVVQLINEPRFQAIKSRLVTARTALAELASGAAILDKLEAAAAANATVKWAFRFLTQELGLDVGHPNAQATIDALVAAGVLTQGEGDALKALALQPASRAEVLGLGRVTEDDIREALK